MTRRKSMKRGLKTKNLVYKGQKDNHLLFKSQESQLRTKKMISDYHLTRGKT